MRVELQVLNRAVSTLFATHPNPDALREAWANVMNDLKPANIPANADNVTKERYDIHCKEYRFAMDLKNRIGAFSKPAP
ncbi:hypothetical protein [Paraburkholderia bannensis]|uniref:hypothetical protein n=1 Tax=Paraburkholderia bannensis TaxID=765414 RepID=UPI0004854164|nr:hypothetical protein [Paraburkholderia bannensis]